MDAWLLGAKAGTDKMTFGVVCSPPRRGLAVLIYINQGHKVKRRTMNFGLWDNVGGVETRVYQLTVADSLTPTHGEKGVRWYGSHRHMGDKATSLQHLDTANFHEALEVFCSDTSLTLEDPIPDPFAFNLT